MSKPDAMPKSSEAVDHEGLTMPMSHLAQMANPQSNFCRHCGKPLRVKCKHCGAMVTQGDYCMLCGRYL